MVVAPGHSVHTKRFIETLLAQGNKVVAICNRRNPLPGRQRGYLYFRFPHLFALPMRFLFYSVRTILGHKIGDRLIFRLNGLLMKGFWNWFRPHVVYVLYVNYMANVCLAGKLKPLVLQCWGSDINQHFSPDADPYERELCSRALAGSDLLLYDAHDMPKKLEMLAGKPVRAVFLHYGVDTRVFSQIASQIRTAWRQRLDIPEEGIVIFSARSWHPKYRHHVILEAFSNVAARLHQPVFLVYKTYDGDKYGEFQEYKDKIMKRSEELGISARVRWVDEVSYEQLPGLYVMSDILVNFPVMDSLGVTLLEAAYLKKRIVSVKLPCYEGTFLEKYACIVPTGEANDLADAIVKVVVEPPNESSLEEARREVERHFTYDSFSQELDKINQELQACPCEKQ